MKKILSIILTICLMFTAVPFDAFTFTASAATSYTEGIYTYTLTDGKATIKSVNSSVSGAVVIPSSLGGYPVVCIGYNAFYYRTSVTSVKIPNTVTTIESYAFDSCFGMNRVDIPDSVTSIGSAAFKGCAFSTVKIPVNITSISSSMFYQCRNLQTVKIPKGVTTIEDFAFYGCHSLTDVWYAGSEQQKNNITVNYSYYNDPLADATWHYNSCLINGTHKYDNTCDADCNLCGDTRTINHSYANNSWVVTKESGCLNYGSRYKICTVCDYVYTETISPLGHSKISHSAKSPTCTEIGWNKYITCSRCDYTTYEEIAATGIHNYIGEETKPTCTAQGYTTYTCSMCNDSYADDYTDVIEHSYDNVCDIDCNVCGAVREITHAYGEWIIDLEPTCVVAGSKHKECAVCGDVVNESIAATGKHNYVGVKTEPTCTAQGYTTYTCDMCNDCYVSDYVDDNGHSYDDEFDAFCNECNAERDAKKHGDSNGDGNINDRDLAIIMQYINGWNVNIDINAADVYDDGEINNKDYALLMRYINGWDVELQ